MTGGVQEQRRTLVRPVPGGWPLRGALIGLGLAFMISDVVTDTVDLSAPSGWFSLVIPYLPLLVLPVGIIVGAVTTLVVFVVTMSAPPDSLMLSAAVAPMLIAIGFAAYGLPRRAALAFGGAFFALLLASALLAPGRLPVFIGLTVTGSLAASAGLAADLFRTRSEVATARVARLREEQAQVRVEERARLALELHDVVAHDVTVIAMQARRAEMLRDPDKSAAILESIGDSASSALQDLRRLVALLSSDAAQEPSALPGGRSAPGAGASDIGEPGAGEPGAGEPGAGEPGGEATAAEHVTAQLRSIAADLERAGFPVELDIEGDLDLVPVSVWQVLSRTMRELGTNVLKYADPAAIVGVRLVVGEAHLELAVENSVADPGSGGQAPSTRAGIAAMRARCEVFGGRVSAGVVGAQNASARAPRSTGHGVRWRTSMTIPLPGRATVEASGAAGAPPEQAREESERA
ncbi:sensor histidine kinase [Serinibacter salmoneus]|uniref:histidine kinase n=1 Tax=Serinibacter salmoneus TaxID=556530 RepID=A0A2A9CVW3_9MICO|nr:histidine kinase [Serinibacter salmoneus]PFG18553.1 signal transduction histidine kinase [Serinibacter salmoneus]